MFEGNFLIFLASFSTFSTSAGSFISVNNNAVTVRVLFAFLEVNRKPNLKLVVFYNERRFLNALTVVQQH